MEEFINNCASLWSVEYEQMVISVLKKGKCGQTLKREDYHILKTFQITSFGGKGKVQKNNGKYMVTNLVEEIIKEAHFNTGHSGVKKTYMKISELYSNIPQSIVSQYILQCERCAEKGLVAESIPPEELSIRELVLATSACGA